ncbi:hypothetical protein OV203_47595 [Nannocystis sp. ILAH1]|uniref:hypothetical protein n=1 Tax=unclassified Nannocystis TaxID=2627009 RepID=UPI002270E617|nr:MULTISPECIES: hypothetical protein [unclassified Nannocystis]MCY0994884.1 hypothetical protein [Nannocystis sp. ILAH1]MCY1065287.1 hypothetical protein [Nannocystis sp. RBIL2]
MATAGVFGALGLGANMGRIITVKRGCSDVGGDPADCLGDAVSLAALGPVALISNLFAFGFAGGAGGTHGRHAAYQTAYAGGRERLGRLHAGLGAGLMTLGILGYIGVRVGSLVDVFGASSCDRKYPYDEASGMSDPDYGQCVRGRWAGYLSGIMLTQATGIVGVGLLAHGASYNRKLRRYRRAIGEHTRLTPSFSPTFAGVSLVGRF